MRWNRQAPVERPEFPKLVPIGGSAQEATGILPAIREADTEACIVDGGIRGVYVRVHNETAEAAARRHGESRTFALDPLRKRAG